MTTSRTADGDNLRGKQSRTTRVTKKVQLIRMLKNRAGTDIATASRKLGWQHHTTRAALTGLRKVGFEITAEKPTGGKPTRYRITAEPTENTTERVGVCADAG